MKTRFFKILLFFAVIQVSCYFLVGYLLNHKKYGLAEQLTKRVWIHRGLYDNRIVFENTIAAFDSAKSRNLEGIELDVYYADSLDDFIVSHDMPNKYGLPVLLLSEVLNRYDTSFYYWLDLKNLTDGNKEKVASKLKFLFHQKIKAKAFVESGEAAPLGYLANKGLNTIYWIQYNRTNFVKKIIKKTYLQWNCLRYHYAGISIGAQMADDDFFSGFRAVPKFIFHIYTPELYHKIENEENIAVYLMDYIPANQ